MSTIEKRLEQLIEDHGAEMHHGWYSYRPKDSEAGAAIIAGWNAAAEAMKALVHATITKDNTGWYCSKCRGSQEFHPERHTPDNCPVAAAQAALARMNGLHDGQDVV